MNNYHIPQAYFQCGASKRRRTLADYLLSGCVALALAALPLRVSASSVAVLDEAHYALPGYATHMPVLVLDARDLSAPEEADGFFQGVSVSVYDRQAANAPAGSPAISAVAALRNITVFDEGLSTQKDDYYLRFDDALSVGGLAPSAEYLLLGGKHDKSLIRNYIGYTLAAEFMEGTPPVRLCEVFLRDANGELYQGVYTLAALPARENTVVLHRSREGDGIRVETSSTRENPDNGKLYLPFFESIGWDDRYSDTIGALSRAEEVLYSTNARVFYSTSAYFDMDSFMAQFILGEVMADYAGMYESYYYYDDAAGLVTAAPIWNFEYALDNQVAEAADITRLKYDKAPYFEQFFKSPQFASQIHEKYLALRQSALDETNLMQLVDRAVNEVKLAVERDWYRWNSYESHTLLPLSEIVREDESVLLIVPVSRQTATYEEELLRLRHTLCQHNLQTAINITQFDFSEQEVHREIVLTSNPVWPILFLIAFFWIVRFVRRYGM